ncbi:uncharacterized protein LOC142786797 [Rhipicephalus microplus]|uniref:uncharacterized protein LOC142786797 n=1 Tax=Rhipicephalus microplus TaxID=6941 RepID=UPI003F6B6D0F
MSELRLLHLASPPLQASAIRNYTRPQLRARLQRAVTITYKYLRRQGLTLSIDKCAVLAFTRKHMSQYSIFINGTAIPAVTHHKFLGVVVHRDLSWTRHVAVLKSKLKSFALILRHVAGARWGPSESSLLQLYDALFVGYIRYSMPVLSNMRPSCVKTLESVQAQCLRRCLGLPRCTSTIGTIAEPRACPTSVYMLCESLRVHLRLLSRHRQHPLQQQVRGAGWRWLPRPLERGSQGRCIGARTKPSASQPATPAALSYDGFPPSDTEDTRSLSTTS